MKENEMIKADPLLRKSILLLVLVIFVFGIFIAVKMQKLKAELVDISNEDPELALEKVLTYMKVFRVMNLVVISLLAAYLFILAGRIISSKQFPPPGMKVIRDAVVRRGKIALRTGYFMIILGIFLLVLVLMVNTQLTKIIETFIR